MRDKINLLLPINKLKVNQSCDYIELKSDSERSTCSSKCEENLESLIKLNKIRINVPYYITN